MWLQIPHTQTHTHTRIKLTLKEKNGVILTWKIGSLAELKFEHGLRVIGEYLSHIDTILRVYSNWRSIYSIWLKYSQMTPNPGSNFSSASDSIFQVKITPFSFNVLCAFNRAVFMWRLATHLSKWWILLHGKLQSRHESLMMEPQHVTFLLGTSNYISQFSKEQWNRGKIKNLWLIDCLELQFIFIFVNSDCFAMFWKGRGNHGFACAVQARNGCDKGDGWRGLAFLISF